MDDKSLKELVDLYDEFGCEHPGDGKFGLCASCGIAYELGKRHANK